MIDRLAAARAVVLDMDGTLLDSEAVYFGAAVLAVRELGYEGAEDACHALIGLPGFVADGLLQERYGPGFPTGSFRACFGRHRDRLLAGGVPLKPGVRELLEALSAAGTAVALATSSMRANAVHHLEAAGILRHFQVVATRDDVQRTKPAPDIYLVAAERLGVAPERCVAIEDSNPGIAAAHAAGTIPIMVPDILPPSLETRARCAEILPDLHAVLALLRDRTALVA